MKKLLLVLIMLLLGTPAPAAEKESAYDRVIATNTLRCGYGVIAPYVTRDPNTGAMGGMIVEIVEEMGKILNIKVEWTDEIGWDLMTTALQAQKIDAICSTLWVSAARGRSVTYTQPLMFNVVDTYTRVDDTRFDAGFSSINKPDVTIATDDGGIAEEIAKHDFPMATRVTMPQAAPAGDFFMRVMTGKADVTFGNTAYFADFNKNNPGKLKALKTARPIRVYQAALAVEIREQELKDMLNAAITELQGSGTIDRIMSRYPATDYPDLLYRPARIYEVIK